MKIEHIFENKNYLDEIISQARIGRACSDSNAIGGALSEMTLCKVFNKNNKKHKLLNVKLLGLIKDKYKIDYSSFAKDYEDLIQKTKSAFGPCSAADFFLFEVPKRSMLTMIDAASLKTTIPKGNGKSDSSKVWIHNDPDSHIYDLIKNKKVTSKTNIGKVITLILREGKARVYLFDGFLEPLLKNFKIKSNKKGRQTISIHLVHKNYRKGKAQIGEIINRNAVTKRKATSFNRGILFAIPNTKDASYFDAMELLVKEKSFKKICETTSDHSQIIQSVIKNYSL